LTREDIVDAARARLEDAPEQLPTMRSLARDLGIAAPSLYWHFSGQAELLGELAQTMLEGGIAWPRPSGHWRADADALARAMRTSILDRPEIAAVLDWNVSSAINAVTSERCIPIIQQGFGEDTGEERAAQLMFFVFGHVIVERGALRQHAGEDDAAVRARRRRFDDMFDRSLRSVLDGMEAELLTS
jgi:AcrR family transcriptional regulator